MTGKANFTPDYVKQYPKLEREIHVAADRPFRVYADGDPIGDVPITVTVRPRCLRVVVPA